MDDLKPTPQVRFGGGFQPSQLVASLGFAARLELLVRMDCDANRADERFHLPARETIEVHPETFGDLPSLFGCHGCTSRATASRR
jgi:hypothetical protein